MKQVFIYNIYPNNRKLKQCEKENIKIKDLIEYNSERKFIDSDPDDGYDSDAESGIKTDWTDYSKCNRSGKEFVMTLFGVTNSILNKRYDICIHVLGYKPKTYIKIPDSVIDTEGFCSNFQKILRGNMTKAHQNDSIVCTVVTDFRSLQDGFRNFECMRAICITTNNSNARRKIISIIKSMKYEGGNIIVQSYKDKGTIELYQVDDGPALKFFTDAGRYGDNLDEWILKTVKHHVIPLENNIQGDPLTDCSYEISIHYQDFIDINKKFRLSNIPKEAFYNTQITWDIETFPRITLYRRILNEIKIKYNTKTVEEAVKIYNTTYDKDRIDDIRKRVIELKHFDPIKNEKEIEEEVEKHDLAFFYVPPVVDNSNEEGDDHDNGAPLTKDDRDEICSIGIAIKYIYDNNLSHPKTISKNIVLQTYPCNMKQIEEINAKEPGLNLTVNVMKEERLIIEFLNIIKRESPEVIGQFNGFTYDYKWMKIKCEDYDLTNKFSKLNRFKNKYQSYFASERNTNQLGINKYQSPKFIGCFDLDLLKYFSDMNKSTHKELNLKFICKLYLTEDVSKKDLNMKEMNRIIYNTRKKNMVYVNELARIAYYNIYDCIALHYLADKTNALTAIMAGAELLHLPLTLAFTAGNSKKAVYFISKVASIYGNYLLRDHRVGKEGALEELYKERPDICEAMKTLENNIRDTIDKAERKKLTKKRDAKVKAFEKEHKIKGGFVQCHKKGKSELICTYDVASMYPSLIKAMNLCHSTLVKDPKYLNIPGVPYMTVRWIRNDFDKTGITYESTFVCERISESVLPELSMKRDPMYIGILPRVQIELGNMRAAIKLQMKKVVAQALKDGIIKDAKNAGDIPLYRSLNCQQEEVKKTMNSIYGITISPVSIFYCPEIGGSITCQGKQYVMYAMALAKEVYGFNTIYGDTDSIFIDIPDTLIPGYDKMNKEDRFNIKWDMNQTAVNKINQMSRKYSFSDMRFELEKMFIIINAFTKKKYFGIKCENKKFDKFISMIQGMDFKKRGATEFDKKIGEIIMTMIIENRVLEIWPFMQSVIKEIYGSKEILLPGNVIGKRKPLYGNELFRKSVNFKGLKSYKVKNTVAPLLYHRIKSIDSGRTVLPGDRIEYTFLSREGNTSYKLYRNRRGTIKEYPATIRIQPFEYLDNEIHDIDYYKFICGAVNQYGVIFDAIFKNMDENYDIEANETKLKTMRAFFIRREILKYDSHFIEDL